MIAGFGFALHAFTNMLALPAHRSCCRGPCKRPARLSTHAREAGKLAGESCAWRRVRNKKTTVGYWFRVIPMMTTATNEQALGGAGSMAATFAVICLSSCVTMLLV